MCLHRHCVARRQYQRRTRGQSPESRLWPGGHLRRFVGTEGRWTNSRRAWSAGTNGVRYRRDASMKDSYSFSLFLYETQNAEWRRDNRRWYLHLDIRFSRSVWFDHVFLFSLFFFLHHPGKKEGLLHNYLLPEEGIRCAESLNIWITHPSISDRKSGLTEASMSTTG